MRVGIVDYGLGNLASVRRAIEAVGHEAVLFSKPSEASEFERLVLPGVGAFADCMRGLERSGWVDELRLVVERKKVPLLGICVGMQLLASRGFEFEEYAGLNLIPGNIRRLVPTDPASRVPHVGWNEVHFTKQDPLLEGIESGTDFYFIHSYRFEPEDAEHEVGFTPYCGKMASFVRRANIFGAQFHPEKSGKPGLRFLKNFIESKSIE